MSDARTSPQEHPGPDGDPGPDEHLGLVSLAVPASTDHIRYLRLVAAGVAAQAGLDYDDIEDLRVAVHELSALSIGAARPGARLSVELRGTAGAVVVTATVAAAHDTLDTPVLDPFVARILGAVVDHYELCAHPGTVGFRVVKCARIHGEAP